jgi:transcriptional regulator with XRE-family HTH domain
MAPDPLVQALRQALARSPASRRALADAAGVDHTLLAHVLAGRRRATPALLRRLAVALRGWGNDCAAAAAILDRALIHEED